MIHVSRQVMPQGQFHKESHNGQFEHMQLHIKAANDIPQVYHLAQSAVLTTF
jgi:hypothetical protein